MVKKNLKKETIVYGMGVTGIDLITILSEKSNVKEYFVFLELVYFLLQDLLMKKIRTLNY